MAKDVSLEFVLRVLRATAFDNCWDIWWRTDNDPPYEDYSPLTFLVNCNDQFYWATADCEELTPANIDEFERAFQDVKAVGDERGSNGAALFCSRVRKMRPQPPFYRGMTPAVAALFDACGPVRDPKECG